jgi:hypothetical protein
VAFVVRHSDGEPNRRICVEYNSSTPTFDPGTRSISGEEVLSLSRVRYQAVDFGGSLGRAVCQVEKEPSQPPGGFTQKNCLGNPYWVLWTSAQSGGWSSAGSGISSQTYADGDAEGLSYGQLSPANPAGICPPPQPKPTPSSTTSPTTSPAAVPSAGGKTPSGRGPTGSPAAGGAAGSPVPGAAVDTPTGSPTAPASAAPATANPNRTPHKTAASGPEVAGVLAAAAAGAALLAMLVLQVLMPRLRR